MRYQYVVILKKGSERATSLLSLLLCLFSAGAFFYLSVRGPQINYLLLPIAAFLLLGAIFLRSIMRQHKTRYRNLLVLAAMGWMFCTPYPWIGVIFVLLAFLEHQTKRPLEIGFDNDRVVINTLFKQRFDWEAFNNVILKDGLLTLDFKSNRLIQREVTEDDEDDDADEDEFNDYCRARLAAAAVQPS